MNARRFAWLLGVLVLLPAMMPAADAPGEDAWRKDLLAWRTEKAERLQAPGGWLSVVGLDWLQAGDNAAGSDATNRIILKNAAPKLAIFNLNGDAILLKAPADGFPKDLLVDGHVPAASQVVATDAAEKPTKITSGTLTITVIKRGERYALRVKDTQSPGRLTFHGLRWYDPQPALRLHAKWIPYNPPKKGTVPTIIGTTDEVTIPGAAEFVIEGQTVRLEPVVDSLEDKELFFILRDATSKTETYGAGRFLYTDLPDHGLSQPGVLEMDLNRAENPPCAYTAYATCPLPPAGNRLKVAIPAGEKRYHD